MCRLTSRNSLPLSPRSTHTFFRITVLELVEHRVVDQSTPRTMAAEACDSSRIGGGVFIMFEHGHHGSSWLKVQVRSSHCTVM